MLKTKIICTLGPASENKEVISRLISAGMNIARLNFSHGTHEEHRARINNLREAAREMGANIALMLDTRGPEIRLGTFKNGKAYLKEGQEFALSLEPIEGNENRVYVTYDGLNKLVTRYDKILLADGLIELEVKEINSKEVLCTVINGGEISDKKGVNVPNKSLPLPAITQKDVEDLLFGISMGIDFVAASFVRKASDVLEIRKILEENGASDVHIIAKVENREGVNNIDEIIRVADGVMVARGDLGVEIPVEEVPLVQKYIIEKCNKAGKPVVTATQMLESMMRNPRPTRAETTDVANAIFDGTDAIMLSGETAAGHYPVEAVKMMAKIARKAEDSMSLKKEKEPSVIKTITDAISHATCSIARDLGVKAIITSTKSGYTARAVAKFRPEVPIIAVTPREKVTRTLQIVRGVWPLQVEDTRSTDEMFKEAVEGALKSGLVQKGDMVVITAGAPVNVTGTTNLIRVHIVGDVLLRGTGIGSRPVSGTVFVARNAKEAMIMPEGSILVVSGTDRDIIQVLRRSSAVIAEEGGLTSHAAIIGLEMNIPVIVGAKGATELLATGDEITMDTQRGLIYRGKVDVK
ncbi:MAG: pyruvate kinase [Thermoanaerobacteraceae bacterium]|jgi:pyruvate kinase|nr:pyruvate kinase [Thermoanaerobacteraceae bacterium]MDN5311817.1 pyruvate kinase [Thermoanaerobacteraceae bacterium]RKL62222.1 pyruvate kinase [Thermoanaerobacteraceae bacterium SP2]